MPYYIEDDAPGCAGWAVTKDDGEVIGCHTTKQDAIDQMVAVSIAEDMEPGGERSVAVRALPDNYRPAVSADVPEGRACGNCVHYNEAMIHPDGVQVWCNLWSEYVRGDHYCNRWEGRGARSTQLRQVDLSMPEYVRNNAARGLAYVGDGYGGDGVTSRTMREARAMADGEITEDKVIRANAWAARHAVDLDAPQNRDPDHPDWPGAGAVAHFLWGIDPANPDPARNWFARKAEQIKAERNIDMTALEAPTESLVRSFEFRAEPSGDGLTLEGYAAVFNAETTIDSWEGAFKRSLGQRMPVLQFDHGQHPLIGSMPIGTIRSIFEDTKGLKVRARLASNWLIEPVRDAIREGAINGMSFRFRVISDSWTQSKDLPVRTITETELMEVGPVVFPAYPQTSVSVRSRSTIEALNDPEVRAEIARILATGTDLRSLAVDDSPTGNGHLSDEETTTATGHVARTRSVTAARAAIFTAFS